MADYFSQTVIRPDIPLTAMTALEYAALGQIFGTERVGDDVYFSACYGPSDIVILDAVEARALLERDNGVSSTLADLVRKALADLDPGEPNLELDMSMIGFEGIFQDIVRRSPLDYVEVETAWTCTKMRPDGFGGAACLITVDDIKSMSTGEWLAESIQALAPRAGPD